MAGSYPNNEDKILYNFISNSTSVCKQKSKYIRHSANK